MAGMPAADGRPDSAASAASEVTLTAAQLRHGGVAWQPVTMGTSAAIVTVPGQIVPNEDRTARLGCAGGRTGRYGPVASGRPVARGQVLVTLQSPEAGTAQSDLAKAQARSIPGAPRPCTRRALARAPSALLALKAIPRQDYERAVADDELAQSAVTQAEAELTRTRSSAEQLGAVASASGEIELRSPLTGVVLARPAVPGTVVEAGAPLAIVTESHRSGLR